MVAIKIPGVKELRLVVDCINLTHIKNGGKFPPFLKGGKGGLNKRLIIPLNPPLEKGDFNYPVMAAKLVLSSSYLCNYALTHLVLDYKSPIAAQGRLRTARGGERTAPTGTFRNREPGVVRQMG